MQNLVVNIVLPKGLAIEGGAALQDDVTFQVVGQVVPWYCSTDQVRNQGGVFMRSASDIAIASQIYQTGRDADALSFIIPHTPHPGSNPHSEAVKEYNRWLYARQQYTCSMSTARILTNMYDIDHSRGVKTLGNFSVTRIDMNKGGGVPKKLELLFDNAEEWAMTLKSGGRVGMGGRPVPVMAAKGLYDPDFPTGRTWRVVGMGANMKSAPGYGGDGKPVKFGSPPVIQFRTGRYMGGYLNLVPAYILGNLVY
jgi:hypothetical protein